MVAADMNQKFFRIVLFFAAAGLALCLLSGCIVRDWCHDLLYGNEPPPNVPIAPAPKPMPGEYTITEAVARFTDSLIFELSSISGQPEVLPVMPEKGRDADFAICFAVYRELLRSKVIRQGRQYLLAGGSHTGNQYTLQLLTPDQKVIYRQTLRLKGEQK